MMRSICSFIFLILFISLPSSTSADTLRHTLIVPEITVIQDANPFFGNPADFSEVGSNRSFNLYELKGGKESLILIEIKRRFEDDLIGVDFFVLEDDSSSENTLRFFWGKKFNRRLALGINFDISVIGSPVHSNRADIDLGLILNPLDDLWIGLVGCDLILIERGRYESRWIAQLKYRPMDWTTLALSVFGGRKGLKTVVGVERWLTRSVGIRLGKDSEGGYSAGVGLKLAALQCDITLIDISPSYNLFIAFTHRI